MKNSRLSFSEPKKGEYGYSIMVTERVGDKSTNNRSTRVAFINLGNAPASVADDEKELKAWLDNEVQEVIEDYGGDTIVRILSPEEKSGFREVINPDTKASMGYYQRFEFRPFDGSNRGLTLGSKTKETSPATEPVAEEQKDEVPF